MACISFSHDQLQHQVRGMARLLILQNAAHAHPCNRGAGSMHDMCH